MSAKQILMATAGAQAAPVFIEDVFASLTYEASSGTQSLNAGVNLLDFGGFAWIKNRTRSSSHRIEDTLRGTSAALSTDTTSAAGMYAGVVNAFTNTGIVARANNGLDNIGDSMAVSLFRRRARFCDVVTWVKGSNTNNRIPHALGSTPGCIIIKSVQPNSSQWFVWHRSLPDPLRSYLLLNDTGGTSTAGSDFWGASAPTATDFGVNDPAFGASGEQWVAIVFAHDAGGFGLLGADHVISCGAFTTNVSGIATVNLGYEPQFLLTKVVTAADNWMMMDQLRGFPATDSYSRLIPNLPNAEGTGIPGYSISPTGFTVAQGTGPFTYIYIAIRRGPMRVPTDPTTVFGMSANTSAIDASNPVVLTPAASDVWMNTRRDGSTGKFWLPRLAGWNYLNSTSTGAEQGGYTWDQRTSSNLRPSSSWWPSGLSQLNYFWRRAPGFCDALVWTGNGADRDVPHNLRAVPELIIHKNRDLATNWVTYSAPTGPSALLKLNTNEASEAAGAVWWRNMSPSESTFPIGSGGNTLNGPAFRYLSLLFASCPGVSKVGSYTGTGAALQVNCGFAAGARFVLIKRINGAGDWHVWDSVRGIVASTDPYLLLNLMDAEVTTTDWIDPLASGFELSSAGGNNVNISGATYLYYAIA